MKQVIVIVILIGLGALGALLTRGSDSAEENREASRVVGQQGEATSEQDLIQYPMREIAPLPGLDPLTGQIFVLDPGTGVVVLDPERQELKWEGTLPDKEVDEILSYLSETGGRQQYTSVYVCGQPNGSRLQNRRRAFETATSSLVFGGSEPRRAHETDEFFLFAVRGRFDFGTFDRGVAVRRSTGEVLRWRKDG